MTFIATQPYGSRLAEARVNSRYVHERHGPHVDREEWTVKFPPTVLADYSAKPRMSASQRSGKCCQPKLSFARLSSREANARLSFFNPPRPA
jgi:hypothetical protein